MGFAVVHMMKIKSGAVGGIQSHNNREHEPKTNPDVDMSRSHENYDLVPCDNYQRAIKEKIADLVVSQKAVRKDAVVACNFIITSDNETMSNLGENCRTFFEDTVKWFADRYGSDRILNATVHMDEHTPHLHLGIVPITEDGKLSAKALFTKTELKSIQTEFARDVGSKYGLERGVEGSERTHLSETRYKLETAFTEYVNLVGEVYVHQQALEDIQQDIEKASERLSEATERLEAVTEDISLMESKKTALKGEIEDLERKGSVLSVQIHEAEAELDIVKSALKAGEEDGVRQFGISRWKENIEKNRENSARDKLARFAEYVITHVSGIKELWEQFERTGKHRSKTHEQTK